MAITFITLLSEGKLLNAYNNNVIEFEPLGGGASLNATVSVGGLSFEITPSPAGEYYFNMKEVMKNLINTNYFQDDIEPENSTAMVYPDPSLYKEVTVDISIQIDESTTQEDSLTLKFSKSVEQEDSVKRGRSNNQNTSIALMLPFKEDSVKDYHATYFEGYPFDVAVFSNIARTITITNKVNGLAYNFDLTKGVNRLFLSDGDNNFSIDNVLPLAMGINELVFSFGETDYISLHLTKIDSCEGAYFKWFNDFGGWSYFLFHPFNNNITTNQEDGVYRDFTNLSNNTTDRQSELSVDAMYASRLFAQGVTPDQMKLIESMIESPKIYRYLNKPFQTSTRNDWIVDKLKAGTTRTFNRIRKTYDVVIETENVKRNKLSL